MKRPRVLPTALLCLALNVACGSDESSGGNDATCEPGQSGECIGGASSSGGSSGISVIPTQPVGGAKSTLPNGRGGTTPLGTGTGGTVGTSTSGTGTAGTAGTSTSGTGTDPNGDCTPKDMSGFSYPSYHPASRAASTCTDDELEGYFADCYSSGNCAAFQAGGVSAGCGSCLLPTNLDSPNYGPLLKLGTDAAYLSSTNLAGCIELVGEPACAAKIQKSQLCEYRACEHCGPSGTGSYRAQMDCMIESRSGVCATAQTEAICIQSSAHLAACSGSSSKTQFMTVAKVFCQ